MPLPLQASKLWKIAMSRLPKRPRPPRAAAVREPVRASPEDLQPSERPDHSENSDDASATTDCILSRVGRIEDFPGRRAPSRNHGEMRVPGHGQV